MYDSVGDLVLVIVVIHSVFLSPEMLLHIKYVDTPTPNKLTHRERAATYNKIQPATIAKGSHAQSKATNGKSRTSGRANAKQQGRKETAGQVQISKQADAKQVEGAVSI